MYHSHQEAAHIHTWPNPHQSQHLLGGAVYFLPDWSLSHLNPRIVWHQFSTAALLHACVLWMDCGRSHTTLCEAGGNLGHSED